MALHFRPGRSGEPPGSALLGELVDHLDGVYPGRAARRQGCTRTRRSRAALGRLAQGEWRVTPARPRRCPPF
jgi:hypothetical protein